MRSARRLLPLLLLLAFFAQGMAHAHHASLTFDEGPHLAVGYTTLRTGDFRLQPVHIHPPLANALAALPLLLHSDLPHPQNIDGWEIGSLSAITDAIIWQYDQPRQIAMSGRFPILLLGILLGALIFRWAKDLSGPRAGLFALALYAFDPNFIAHSSLITTDMAAVFFSVATLYALERSKTARRQTIAWAGVGILLGLAQLAKVSALLLVPVVGISVASYMLQVAGWRKGLARLVRRALWVLVTAGLVVWAGYGFEVGLVSRLPFPVPAATHVKIFLALREHYTLGHPTFLMGQVSDQGWWWYFPVAFLLKTPLPVLALGAGCLGLGAWRLVLSRFKFHGSRLVLILFPLLYAFTSLFSTVNIGYRHLLPLLPFIYIGIGTGVASLMSKRTNQKLQIMRKILQPVTLGALIWLLIGTLGIAPHYLTFFNEIAGGPDNGYKSLVDSNLDWGQNIWDLKAWMEENDHDHVYYAHYSPARPESYGINADFLPPDPRAVEFSPWQPEPGLYAIGATVLQGPYAPNINTYAWFRTHRPTAHLGNALFIYEAPQQSTPTWAGVCTHLNTVLPYDVIAQNLGVPQLRTIRFDCEKSRVYAQSGAGIYVLPTSAEVPTFASLSLEARHPDGTEAHAVYHVDSTPKPDVAISATSSDGPLRFLGYQITQTEAKPGDSLTLQTYWKVKNLPERPLSLMAHLVVDDGAPIAVGDGLGIPTDEWQIGDTLVQKHPLRIPSTATDGKYIVTTGGYWLDNMERWQWKMASTTADQLHLTEIQIEREKP